MTSARAFVAALLLASLAAAAGAQSLAEVAGRDQSKRKKGAATKVYTNDDLSKDASPSSGKPSPSPSPPAPEAPPERDIRGTEAAWKGRAQAARAVIGAAEARVKEIEARIAALSADVAPADVGDPFRLQALEGQKAQALEALGKAKEALAQARKSLEDLEEEARRQGVPPGWLREP